jgi:hypothetical protein
VRITETRTPPCQDEPPLKVADERLLVHTAAVPKGVTIKKNIAGNGTTLKTGEQIPRELVRWLERYRTRHARLDARRTVIHGQTLTIAKCQSGVCVGIDIAERTTEVRRKVEIESEQCCGGELAPTALAGQENSQFIVELGIPALRLGRINDFVDEFLGLLCI